MSDYKSKLDELLLITAKQNASDLHLIIGQQPTLRIDSVLVPIQNELLLTPEATEGLVGALLTPEQKESFLRRKELDFSYSLDEKARFRVNVYFQRGSMSVAFRFIPSKIRTIDELSLPPIMHDFTKLSQGFFLAVGPAGQGKSTTLAALVDEINHQRTEHIITIEDPIEYIFIQNRSIISQREVGQDTLTFHKALRSVLRQDPDVIMIGEMRDPISISTALTAAETGHLVFSTLHTNSAAQTIDRIIDTFPPEQQSQIASQLAATLVGIISQRLIPKLGGGRVPAYEIMMVNSAIKNLIREKKIYQVDLVIETSSQEGMITLNHSLADLVKRGVVSRGNAELHSTNLADFRILLEKSSSSRSK